MKKLITPIRNISTVFALFAGVLSTPVDAAYNPANIPAVPTIAAMQTIGAPQQYPSINVIGYNTGTTVGGGLFNWNPTSTATPDACVTFAASGISTGRWVRQSVQVITPSMCGTNVSGDFTVSDAVVTSGASPTVTSGSHTFVSADVGKIAQCYGAGATVTDGTYSGGNLLNTTVASVSAGHAILTSSASNAVSSNGRCSFLADNSTALQAFFNAASNYNSGIGFGPIPNENPYFSGAPQNNMLTMELGGTVYGVNNTIALPQFGNVNIRGLTLTSGPSITGVVLQTNPVVPSYGYNIILDHPVISCGHVAATGIEVQYSEYMTIRDPLVVDCSNSSSKAIEFLAGAEVWRLENAHVQPYTYCEIYDFNNSQCLNTGVATLSNGTGIYTTASDGVIDGGQVDTHSTCIDIEGGASVLLENINAECTQAAILHSNGANLFRVLSNNFQGTVSFPTGCLFMNFSNNIGSAILNPSTGAAGAWITDAPAASGFAENDCSILNNQLSAGSFTTTGNISLSAQSGTGVTVTDSVAEFTANMVGATIALTSSATGGATGLAQVASYTNPTHVVVSIFQTFGTNAYNNGSWYIGASLVHWLGNFGGSPLGSQARMTGNVVGQGPAYYWPEAD